MTEENSRLLVLLERSHVEAEDALRDLRARWLAEDEQTARERHKELERHVQGAIDRDKVRVALGGTSKIPVPRPAPDPNEEIRGDDGRNQPEKVDPDRVESEHAQTPGQQETDVAAPGLDEQPEASNAGNVVFQPPPEFNPPAEFVPPPESV